MEEIREYRLYNEFLDVTFINIGAAITKLVDRKTRVNIIVGHQEKEDYRENPGYMNTVIGRHAGRLCDFTLQGKGIELEKTGDERCQLHGGSQSLCKKIFSATVREDEITFETTSPDGEGGYPGEVELSITYRLVRNELHLIYRATTTETTVLNLTNHAYFNLNGRPDEPITNHRLTINANRYIKLDEHSIPSTICSLDHSPLDFREMKEIREVVLAPDEQVKRVGGIDHPYLIDRRDPINYVATLYSPLTMIQLDVYSDQDAVVVYSGNVMDERLTLNGNIKGMKHSAICFETQGIPNAFNIPECKSEHYPILKLGSTYRQHTIWRIH